ncbi:DUF4168 domain-containing protein [Leptolyngbya ohadii]|uniref:DUF4168 domain-containing protein n=1 Tax=Leptolyngbya ohadii TaxID=1962290 RepID=UPI0019D45480|nr:DUF4168 domain-containing protein [Leptolyngbya ohadii]
MSRLKWNRHLLQFCLIATASATGVLMGWVPTYHAPTASVTFSSSAQAQAVSNDEIQRYARAVLAIEPLRQSTYNTIKNQVGYVPAIRCDVPSSLQELDSSIRQNAIDFCNSAIQIADRNQLSITRFNQITAAHESDPALAERIRQAILQLQ